jgi:hypothetical protein
MHSVQQHGFDVSHGIANIQSRSQQADNIVLRQASLLRRLLQSLYRNEDGHPVFGLHDFMPPQIVCLCRSTTDSVGPSHLPTRLVNSSKLKPSVQKLLSNGANDGGVDGKSTL